MYYNMSAFTRTNDIPIFLPNNFAVTILEPREIGKYYNKFALHLHNIVFIITNKQNIIQLRNMLFSRSRSVVVAIRFNILTVTRIMYTNNHCWILFNIFYLLYDFE